VNKYLANALRSPQDEWVASAFYEEFQSAKQWRDYLVNHFMSNGCLDVGTILDKERGWHAVDFQALYVACWTYKPVVKGSYMLKIEHNIRETVQRGYNKLPSRWTSHLHTENKGGAGSNGWRFLKGYHELLIQMETANGGDYLFLKCEGHPAISVPHIKSYFHKKVHGVGLDVNEELLTVASDQGMHVGINVRRAENYSPSYKTLMQELGKKKHIKKHGEIVNVREAAALMINAARETGREVGDGHKLWLANQLQPHGVPRHGNIPEDHFANTQAGTVADVLQVILDYAQRVLDSPKTSRSLVEVWNRWSWIRALSAAQHDVQSVIRELRKDQQRGNTNTVRYFEEVVVTRTQVNHGLVKANQLLGLPKERLL
jgi:hypothetical protein